MGWGRQGAPSQRPRSPKSRSTTPCDLLHSAAHTKGRESSSLMPLPLASIDMDIELIR